MARLEQQDLQEGLLFVGSDGRVCDSAANQQTEIEMNQSDELVEPVAAPPTGADQAQSEGEHLCASSLGNRLRDARRRRGVQVDDVADTLNIQACLIRSMEDGEFDKLPTSYEVGFFRTYANYLGPRELGVRLENAIELLREEFPVPHRAESETVLDMHKPIFDWKAKLAVGASVVALAIFVFAWGGVGQAGENVANNDKDIPIQYTFSHR